MGRLLREDGFEIGPRVARLLLGTDTHHRRSHKGVLQAGREEDYRPGKSKDAELLVSKDAGSSSRSQS